MTSKTRVMYRLVTRSDFDGLICAVLLKSRGLIDDIAFAHPNDVQHGRFEVTDRDILTNLPYDPRAYMVFDHHSSEILRTGGVAPNQLIVPSAPSAARVVYDHFGGEHAFPSIDPELMEAVDKADSAQYTIDEVLTPTGWTLLNFVMDSRTGLGRFHDFRISNYQLMMELIDHIRFFSSQQILDLPDVAERTAVYYEQEPHFAEQLRRCTTVHGALALTDVRAEERIHAGNRFMVYAIHPRCNVSALVMPGRNDQNVVIAIGKSIFDRSSTADVGQICLRYGGGGHKAAGTCQVDHGDAERIIGEIVAELSGDGC